MNIFSISARCAVIFAGLVSICSCTKPGAVSPSERKQGCEYEFLASHQVGTISTLSDLPEGARRRLEEELRHRVGDTIYSRMHLAGGEVAVHESLVRSKGFDSQKVPAFPDYLLYFLLPADDGSEGYCVPITIDTYGHVHNHIDLPGRANDPRKATIISKSSALAIAVTQGAPVDTTWAEMVYVIPCDCLEWIVKIPNGRNGSGFKQLDLHINAHDPRKLSWSESILYF